MERVVLYRKYRSRSLSEVVGQQHITSILQASLEKRRFAHAYLFVGPRGVGKTSVARIMAFAINEKPYSDAGHVDIIEIDAASNRRIDEVRSLKEKIHIAPLELAFKIYIIDEVHMLTKEAFNALLKTLEEPPSHAIFILATTELHKVPPTIVSRTQQFVFRPIPSAAMIEHLKRIATKEKIEVDPSALALIASQARGSFRDSISLLDQLATARQAISEKDVEQSIGYADQPSVQKIISLLLDGSTSSIDALLDELYLKGAQASSLAAQLIDAIKVLPPSWPLLKCLDDLLTIESSSAPHIALEVALLKTALRHYKEEPQTSAHTLVVKEPKSEIKTKSNLKIPKTTSTENGVKLPKKIENHGAIRQDSPVPPSVRASSKQVDPAHWSDILTKTKQKSYPLYTLIRMAEATQISDRLELAFNFDFHTKRLNEGAYREVLMPIITEVYGRELSVECLTRKDARPSSQEVSSASDVTDLSEVSEDFGLVMDTFGGAERLKL